MIRLPAANRPLRASRRSALKKSGAMTPAHAAAVKNIKSAVEDRRPPDVSGN